MVIVNRRVCIYEINRNPFWKCMGENPAVFDNKKIGNIGIAAHPVIEQILKADQIIDENFIGGIQCQAVRNIFGLNSGKLEKRGTVTVGDDLRNNQAAGYDDDRNHEKESFSKILGPHVIPYSLQQVYF